MGCRHFFRGIVACIFIIGGILVQPQGVEAQDASPLTVATVDGKEFSLNLVGFLANQLPDDVRNQPLSGYYGRIIDDIIDTRLTAEAARESGLLDNRFVKEIAERAVDRVLAEAWLNDEINRRITDEMLKEAYDDLIADTEGRTETRARHILLASEDEAKAVIQRLDDGEDFAELAKELSTGPSAPNGGELGYFRRGAMVPSFEAASFDLEVGSYSKAPIQTQFGWHVIKVEDRRIAEAPALEAARNQLRGAVSVEIAGTIIAELRDEADITSLDFEAVRQAEQARQGQN